MKYNDWTFYKEVGAREKIKSGMNSQIFIHIERMVSLTQRNRTPEEHMSLTQENILFDDFTI